MRWPKILFALFAITALVGTTSCGEQTGAGVGFFDWYMREYRKGAQEMKAREDNKKAEDDRSRRFWAWVESLEGQRAIAARTEQVLVSPSGLPDTVYDMSSGTGFKISSRAAGVTLTGYVDYRDARAHATFHRADGSKRKFTQGLSADTLGELADGAFDEDDRLVAALLRFNPRSGWPGRALKRTHPKRQSIAADMWQQMTGEKLRGYSSFRSTI
jgi:lambda repressor-like predicted transcriptional regulator